MATEQAAPGPNTALQEEVFTPLWAVQIWLAGCLYWKMQSYGLASLLHAGSLEVFASFQSPQGGINKTEKKNIFEILQWEVFAAVQGSFSMWITETSVHLLW